MCDFDEFIFTCGHSAMRLKWYCHRARNHPNHHCGFVKKLRACWDQPNPCDACLAEMARLEQEEIARQQWLAFYGQTQGQGEGQGGNGSQS